MNISSPVQTVPSSSTTAPVSAAQAISPQAADVRGSVFKPVPQVLEAQNQRMNLRPGAVHSPLHNAVQAYGFEPDIAASLLTYGADGKMPRASTHLIQDGNQNQNPDLNSTGSGSQALQGAGDSKAEVQQAEAQKTEAVKKEAIANQQKEEIQTLAARDREVRAHEQAHAAVGGAFAGAPKYEYEQGPNGVSYAVGGEVPIDVGPAATPELTLDKAQTVRRAALAPTEPSPQDRQVAQQAMQLESQARVEIAAERAEAQAVNNGQEANSHSHVENAETKTLAQDGSSSDPLPSNSLLNDSSKGVLGAGSGDLTGDNSVDNNSTGSGSGFVGDAPAANRSPESQLFERGLFTGAEPEGQREPSAAAAANNPAFQNILAYQNDPARPNNPEQYNSPEQYSNPEHHTKGVSSYGSIVNAYA